MMVWLLLAACGSQPHWTDTLPSDPCDPAAYPKGPIVVDVTVGDRDRRGLVWLPPTRGPWDLVVNLHEFRSDPLRQQHYSGWIPYAQEAGVMLLAPDGKSSTWNAGPCCGRAMEQGVDDVAFLNAIVAKVAAACTTGNVLATGIGNGAMMAERWACESDVPDAVVSVGGALQTGACPQSRPIPVLHYHGGADRFVPADGSPGVLHPKVETAGHVPVSASLALWQARNQAQPAEPLTDGALSCTQWTGGAPLAACTIAEGADTWPGSANGAVLSSSPLANATQGAWAWVQAAWGNLR